MPSVTLVYCKRYGNCLYPFPQRICGSLLSEFHKVAKCFRPLRKTENYYQTWTMLIAVDCITPCLVKTCIKKKCVLETQQICYVIENAECYI